MSCVVGYRRGMLRVRLSALVLDEDEDEGGRCKVVDSPELVSRMRMGCVLASSV